MDCSFCGHGIPRGTETIFVTKRGKALYFCSSKCEKNMLKLGRKPRETKWTDEYREEKAIRIKSSPVPPAPVKEKEEIKKEGGIEQMEETAPKEEKPTEKKAKEPKEAKAKKPKKKGEKKSPKGTGKK
jgi:large subunit ribosomal protein L24e